MWQIEHHPVKGRIVVATKDIQKGETVVASRLVRQVEQRDRYSLQKAADRHIYVDEPGILFSHSCEPNLGLRDNAEAFDFVAATDIPAGTELTFHYGMSEIYSVAVDACACGSSRCAGRSVGFAEMTPEERARLMALGVSQHAMQIHSALQIA